MEAKTFFEYIIPHWLVLLGNHGKVVFVFFFALLATISNFNIALNYTHHTKQGVNLAKVRNVDFICFKNFEMPLFPYLITLNLPRIFENAGLAFEILTRNRKKDIKLL